jgi:gamma-aminobutyric acid type B receptor
LTFDHETVSIDGNTVACNSTVWLATLGLGVVFSALFAKTYRINRIMNSAQKFRRIKITVKQTLVPVAIVLLLNLIVLSVMTTQDPILYEIAVLTRDGFGRPLASYGFCNYREAEGYLIALAVINIGTLLFALYQSWLARRLSSEFAESR